MSCTIDSRLSVFVASGIIIVVRHSSTRKRENGQVVTCLFRGRTSHDREMRGTRLARGTELGCAQLRRKMEIVRTIMA